MYTSDSHLETLLSEYLIKLNNWVGSNGWAGWDPYDIYNNKFGMWVGKRKTLIQKASGSIISQVNHRFPMHLRNWINVKPSVNAKAMGLFAEGYLKLEFSKKFQNILSVEKKYNSCFQWLDNNKIVKYGGIGWGYPFDWMSRIFIPKNTPTVVNSAIIGDAYWPKYKIFKDEKALSQCENICHFIVKGLNRSGYKDDGSFSFSYTPLDKFQVHNANLFGAEFIIRVGMETGQDEWVDAGLLATKFSLSEIRDDGTLNYWSYEQAKGVQQDTYHSGFEIRALSRIAILTELQEIKTVANAYFNTWITDYYSASGEPNYIRGQTDVIEVHSCAEAILCTTEFYRNGYISKSKYLKLIKNIMFSAKKLWVRNGKNKGYFASSIKNKTMTDIPYIRWGQAWMFNAISNSLTSLNENEVKNK